MESQVFINAIFGVSAFLGGWVLNNITRTINRIDKDLRDMPHLYVTKDTYHRDIDELKDICRQIFAKLDHKADK
jgi:hypothetical protein